MKTPYQCEREAEASVAKMDFKSAAASWREAASVSHGAKRRDEYERFAKYCDALVAQKKNGCQTNIPE